MEFPIFNTKKLSDGKVYDINDPADRRQYFDAKAGDKIERIKEYLDNNTFVAFMLAKKSAGKGTYAKMFEEIVGPDRFHHLSVGDIVRDVHKAIEDPKEKEDLQNYLNKYYRGFISVEDALDAFISKSQDKLIPTEFILTLVKREIEKLGRKALFIDGLPRSLDQISYSLYFRDLINFRHDPDFFILIDIPESIIDARMKARVVCSKCNTSRSVNLLPTKFPKYDSEAEEYYLACDNSACEGFGEERMIGKEGDSAGIESIRKRLDTDGKLIKMATSLSGIPIIKLRNAVPVEKAEDLVEEFEVTPMYSYKGEGNDVEVIKQPWVVKDDNGVDSYSLLAPAVVISLINQMHDILFPEE